MSGPKPWDWVYEINGDMHRPAGDLHVTCCGIEVPDRNMVPVSLAVGTPCRDEDCFGPDDLMALADSLSIPPCAADVDRYVTLVAQRSRR